MPLDSNMEQETTEILKTKDPNKYQQPPHPPHHFEMLSLSEFVMETKGTQKYAFPSLYVLKTTPSHVKVCHFGWLIFCLFCFNCYVTLPCYCF